MRVCETVTTMRAECAALRYGGRRLGLVPTMGALHEGHLSLLRAARAQCDIVAASIFVNPTQFGPDEDLARYPRPFTRDTELLRSESVDLLFAPSVEEMYPQGAVTYVNVEGLSERLCGRSRPGHFRGVATVVSKLFHIVKPEVAFFGQKDAAQVAVIRAMVRDLLMPAEIVACPIVREADGLALSSRNVYLDPEQRRQALVLSRSLSRVLEMYESGERDAARLISAGVEEFSREPKVELDFVEIVDGASLEPLETAGPGALVAVAGLLGRTRLIDNVVLPS
jgi:pantoate--beta-alanine ligase